LSAGLIMQKNNRFIIDYLFFLSIERKHKASSMRSKSLLSFQMDYIKLFLLDKWMQKLWLKMALWRCLPMNIWRAPLETKCKWSAEQYTWEYLRGARLGNVECNERVCSGYLVTAGHKIAVANFVIRRAYVLKFKGQKVYEVLAVYFTHAVHCGKRLEFSRSILTRPLISPLAFGLI